MKKGMSTVVKGLAVLAVALVSNNAFAQEHEPADHIDHIDLKDLRIKEPVEPNEPVEPREPHFVEPKEPMEIPFDIRVADDVRVGRVKAIELDPRIHTEPEIQDHKDSPAGSDHVGITIEFK